MKINIPLIKEVEKAACVQTHIYKAGKCLYLRIVQNVLMLKIIVRPRENCC